jgi:DNA (cytosine-5)-methyltransferase 1
MPDAAELFAGVGGFRIGLERAGWDVTWSNQYEPSTPSKQHASDCYLYHYPDNERSTHTNRDIAVELDEMKKTKHHPAYDLLVGGFPCQDYSVARVLNQAYGLAGKKGVLWWEIRRMVSMHKPKFLFLENVDRLLKSPAPQRGRDFAIILACLSGLGYEVEWRVINAADYGFPQKRRRVFIVGRRTNADDPPAETLSRTGVLARAFPVETEGIDPTEFRIKGSLPDISDSFGTGDKISQFKNAGFMRGRDVWTANLRPIREASVTLQSVLQPTEEVAPEFFIAPEKIPGWVYLKGAKRLLRVHKASGASYVYAEGGIPFPDPVTSPSRTILTGEGGTAPSRFKHVIAVGDDRYRRLTPIELERLNGFEPNWTDTGLSDTRRAFLMGNALVVGLIERVGLELKKDLLQLSSPSHDAIQLPLREFAAASSS